MRSRIFFKRLLEASAATVVLAAFVIPQVGIPDERACTGDREIPVHVPVHVKNCSVLGFVRRFANAVNRGVTRFLGQTVQNTTGEESGDNSGGRTKPGGDSALPTQRTDTRYDITSVARQRRTVSMDTISPTMLLTLGMYVSLWQAAIKTSIKVPPT